MTPPLPTAAALRHMAARLVDRRDAALRDGTLHPDSLRAARLVEEADTLRALADALDRVTPEGLAALEWCMGFADVWEGDTDAGRDVARARATLAAVRALLERPASADGPGRVVGAIERALGAGEE